MRQSLDSYPYTHICILVSIDYCKTRCVCMVLSSWVELVFSLQVDMFGGFSSMQIVKVAVVGTSTYDDTKPSQHTYSPISGSIPEQSPQQTERERRVGSFLVCTLQPWNIDQIWMGCTEYTSQNMSLSLYV